MAVSIAWKRLSIAITRIDRNVVITKVCNDILPTMKVLHKMKQSANKKCTQCLQTESQEHMLLRNDASTLQIELKKKRTGDALIDHMCSAIIEWLDTGVVQVQKYPEQIRTTLSAQTETLAEKVNKRRKKMKEVREQRRRERRKRKQSERNRKVCNT